MSIQERLDRAAASRKRGYNCCQAVLCAYADRYDIPESDLLKVSEGFGHGMGSMSVCGAVTAMVIMAGLENADGNVEKNTTKKISTDMAAKMQEEFANKNSSLICREIKGVDTGEVLRSCEGCIEDAIKIVGEYLGEQ